MHYVIWCKGEHINEKYLKVAEDFEGLQINVKSSYVSERRKEGLMVVEIMDS